MFRGLVAEQGSAGRRRKSRTCKTLAGKMNSARRKPKKKRVWKQKKSSSRAEEKAPASTLKRLAVREAEQARREAEEKARIEAQQRAPTGSTARQSSR